MNDRIKELAVQANLLIKKTNGDEYRYGIFDPNFEKFAELIIRECLYGLKERIAIRYKGSYYDCAVAYGMEMVYYDIVDKFGVEE